MKIVETINHKTSNTTYEFWKLNITFGQVYLSRNGNNRQNLFVPLWQYVWHCCKTNKRIPTYLVKFLQKIWKNKSILTKLALFLINFVTIVLEAICCKERQKKVPDQLLVWEVGDLWRTWRNPNWFWMSLSFSHDHLRSV